MGGSYRPYLQSPVYVEARLPSTTGPQGQDIDAVPSANLPIQNQQQLTNLASPGAFRPGALAGRWHIGKSYFTPIAFLNLVLVFMAASGVAHCVTAR